MSEGSPTERFGPYLVYEQLGVGGMAQVHRAVNASSGLHRPVALKRMLAHIANSEDMVKSFVREARLASYLRHENVAQTYELGKVGDVYFIAMELVTGRNLREVLRHCGATTGPMPVPVALNILNQICDALDYAHNLCDETGQPLRIVHRDVSPSNVIVSESGAAKLIDFGIAKASGGGMQTMSGTLKGKFAYMAPEYIGGRLDARADLFAVGVIAHELLTNRPLFSGRDDIDTLTRVRDMQIAPPSKKNPLVPPEIDDIVMTALARDPDRRWQHATALRTALTTLTRRLGLVAGNTQVVQWLDWAFSHPPRPASRKETDTAVDAEPVTSDPSIVIEHRTVDLSSSSQRMTVIKPAGNPEPPSHPPVGTPSAAAQRSSAPIIDLVKAVSDAASRQPSAPAGAAAPPGAESPGFSSRVPGSLPPATAPPPASGSSPPATAPKRASGSSPPVAAPQPQATILQTPVTQPRISPMVAAPQARVSGSPPVAAQPHVPVLQTPVTQPRVSASPPPVAAPPASAPMRARSSSNPPPAVGPTVAQNSPAVAGSGLPALHIPIGPAAKTFLSTPSPQNPPAPSPAVQGSQAIPATMIPGLGGPLPPGAKTFLSTPSPFRQAPSSIPAVQGSQTLPTTGSGPGAQPPPAAPSTSASSVSGTGAPAPAVPPRNAAPFGAPRPSAASPVGLQESGRSAMAARELARRAPASSTPTVSPAAPPGNRLLTVVLVILAAAIAAITVYFVLPLLT